MALVTFKDTLDTDMTNMFNTNEFAVNCLNVRTGLIFGVIFEEVSVNVDGDGMPIILDNPMIYTKSNNDVLQNDTLTIEGTSYYVDRKPKDGINGMEVYLKYA